MKTYLPDAQALEKKWYVVDARDQVLGRLASRLASILMGKEKAHYTSFLDTGDFIIVVNASRVRLSGKKWDDKVYYSHSGYPGSIQQITARELRQKHPERLIEFAVRGMLPKTRLGRRMLKKLKIYAGEAHPHQAQKPEPLAI